MPVLPYDPTKSEDKQDPRVNVGGPDGALFALAEDVDLNTDNYYDAGLATTSAAEVDDLLVDKFGQLGAEGCEQLQL